MIMNTKCLYYLGQRLGFYAFGLLLFASVGLAQPAEVIRLWPGEAPDEVPGIGAEYVRMSPVLDVTQVVVTESTRMITNVTVPTVELHRPPKEIDTGVCVVICPGGGYWNLYWELEGEEVAKWLNEHGISGAILKYRVPRRSGEVEAEPAKRPLQDAQRAIRLLRSRGSEWGIDPNRIGIIGFSAGGHLAMSAATRFEKRAYPFVDERDLASCRPDFAIAVYSGYLKNKNEDTLSSDIIVAETTPPVFLVHGGDDLVSSPEQSLFMYLALKRAKIPAELHIYAATAHDFGVRRSDRPYAGWTDACIRWLRDQSILPKTGDKKSSDQHTAK
jgi:acetyl esterase/lipase